MRDLPRNVARRWQALGWPWGPALAFCFVTGCTADLTDLVAVPASLDSVAADGGSTFCTTGTPLCKSDFAAAAFGRALCTCGDVTTRATMTTEVVTGGDPQTNASVGIGGTLVQALAAQVAGDLTVSGATPLSIVGGIQVAGDLRLAGGGSVAGGLDVTGDAWLLSTLTTLGLATIGRNVHLAPGASLSALVPAAIGGQTSTAAFSIDPPCDCAAESALDVGAVVASAQTKNDNAAMNVPVDALSAPIGSTDFGWGCGTIYLSSIGATVSVRIGVSGRVALLVGGDVSLSDSFSLELGPGAALDWFIAGRLTIAAGARIGDPARPGAIRVYVLGNGDITLPGDSTVSLSLYAPAATVTVAGRGDVYGSLFASAVQASFGLTVHDDPQAASERCSTE